MKTFTVKTSDGEEILFEYTLKSQLGIIRMKLEADEEGNTRYTKQEVYDIFTP